jgi:hypothetical protein
LTAFFPSSLWKCPLKQLRAYTRRALQSFSRIYRIYAKGKKKDKRSKSNYAKEVLDYACIWPGDNRCDKAMSP